MKYRHNLGLLVLERQQVRPQVPGPSLQGAFDGGDDSHSGQLPDTAPATLTRVGEHGGRCTDLNKCIFTAGPQGRRAGHSLPIRRATARAAQRRIYTVGGACGEAQWVRRPA